MTAFTHFSGFPYYLGTTSPYPYPCTSHTPPPSGYEPFYINYLGRHGARYLENKDKLTFLLQILQKNDESNNLTLAGIQLRKDLEQIEAIQKNHYGDLTPYGAQMMKDIAYRIYHSYPTVFGRKIYAESTFVQRVIDSMFAFLDELFLYTPRENALIYSNGEIDPFLRFFDLNVAYNLYKESAWWKPMIELYKMHCNPSVEIGKQFFYSPLETSIIEEFIPSLFDVLVEEYDITEAPLIANNYLTNFFSDYAKYYYWEMNNLNEYFEKGPSKVDVMLPTNISFALLRNFIETSDRAVQTKEISANFRFAHAETIIPFASILKLCCCSKQTNSLSKVSCIWRDFEVAPMAANIAWIFYKHPIKKDILVKMTYNEEEICFPFQANSPYVDWQEVRNFYCSYLNSLCIDCSQNTIDQVSYYNECAFL